MDNGKKIILDENKLKEALGGFRFGNMELTPRLLLDFLGTS